MRIFVTGGTGFIGSHFLNKAFEAGYEVCAIRRPGSTPRVPLIEQPIWLERGLDSVEVADFEGIEAVVHLAAHSVNVPYDTLQNCLYWNVTVAMAMLDKARQAGVKRFVLAGSCFEYGRSGERYEFIPPDAPLEPTASYSTSKAAASIAAMGFAREHSLSHSILRIFQVFGEGELPTRLWPSLRKAALAGEDFPMSPGMQVRDFTPVELVAKRFCEELETPSPPGQPKVVNVGTGTPQTILQFAEEWWRRFGATGRVLPGRLPYRSGEVMRYVSLV